MFASSRDGTRVPFFLTAPVTLPRDGATPAMMYGYGGFSVDTLPTYRPDVPAWLERGGIWITVNVRGGSEYGEAWHRAGMRDQKQNVFDDFIAVAEHLVAERYTSPSHLAMLGRIERRSAGRGGDGAAARSVCRGAAGGRRPRHASV